VRRQIISGSVSILWFNIWLNSATIINRPSFSGFKGVKVFLFGFMALPFYLF
jgi:hypothetical protein